MKLHFLVILIGFSAASEMIDTTSRSDCPMQDTASMDVGLIVLILRLGWNVDCVVSTTLTLIVNLGTDPLSGKAMKRIPICT